MSTLNNHVVNFVRRNDVTNHTRHVNSSPTLEIEALGEGEGDLLKVSMEMGDACRKQKSRIMSVSYAYIKVDFSPAERPQGDAARYTSDNIVNAPDNVVTYKKGPGGAVNAVNRKRPMTSLEIGIYVLLAVCCIAISVFLVNFAVFVRRYKIKLKEHPSPVVAPPNRNSYIGSLFSGASLARESSTGVPDGGSGFVFGFGSGGGSRRKVSAPQGQGHVSRNSVANANDWVWIGKQTLQRNAIPTECARTLMPIDQFAHVNRAVSHLTAAPQHPPAHEQNAMTSSNGGVSSSNRSSSCIMGTSQLLGSSGHAAGEAGTSQQIQPPHNVAMYKGSECSIRITPNPLTLAAASSDVTRASSSTLPRQRSNTHRPLPPNNSFQPYDKPLPPTPVDTHQARTLPRRMRAGEPFYANTDDTRATPQYAAPNKKRANSTGRRAFDAGALSDIPSASGLSASSLDDVMDLHGRHMSPATRGTCDRSSLSSASSASRSTSSGGARAQRAPTPLQQARLAQFAADIAQRAPLAEQQELLAQAAAQIAEREEDVANGNLTDASAEWDYDAMGMTYGELMEYFDNLKESTA